MTRGSVMTRVVSNLLFRFMSRFVFGHAKTIEDYLAALDAHLRSLPH